MLASILMGLVGGQRSMTPLAAVAVAAAGGHLPRDRAAPDFLRNPAIATGAASGSSTSRSFCAGVIPTASAASVTAVSIPASPATPFRSSGSIDSLGIVNGLNSRVRNSSTATTSFATKRA